MKISRDVLCAVNPSGKSTPYTVNVNVITIFVGRAVEPLQKMAKRVERFANVAKKYQEKKKCVNGVTVHVQNVYV